MLAQWVIWKLYGSIERYHFIICGLWSFIKFIKPMELYMVSY